MIDWQTFIMSALIIQLRILLVVNAADLVFSSTADLQSFEDNRAKLGRRKGRYSIRETDLEVGC